MLPKYFLFSRLNFDGPKKLTYNHDASGSLNSKIKTQLKKVRKILVVLEDGFN